MITLHRETDYAIHLLKELAKTKTGNLSLHEAADSTGVSFHFLQKIARKLRMARLIKAGQGATGGYRLNISPKKITLLAIVEAMEKKSAILPCLCVKNGTCPGIFKKCALKGAMGKTNKKIAEILKKTTLDKI